MLNNVIICKIIQIIRKTLFKKQCVRRHLLKIKFVIVPTKLRGEEICTQTAFFVPSILANRYIRRRELSLVSLESPSRIDNWNKKIFLIIVFYMKLSKFQVLWITDGIPLFSFTFSVFFDQISATSAAKSKKCYSKGYWFYF